jgi:hypothetical protein
MNVVNHHVETSFRFNIAVNITVISITIFL